MTMLIVTPSTPPAMANAPAAAVGSGIKKASNEA
jgi:hypothetical protein